MTLLRKDGTPYQLKKPNPLMTNQEFDEKFYVHNQQYFGKEISDVQKYIKLEVREIKQKVVEKNLENLEPIAVEKPPIIQNIVVKEEKINFWCLPMIIKHYHDKLYDEVKIVKEFGSKYTFQAVTIDPNEMNYTIATTMEILEGSIVYSIRGRRWWKVVKCEKIDNKYKIICMPSADQPSFE